jgi:FAD/FMN-containing dehydrogenase
MGEVRNHTACAALQLLACAFSGAVILPSSPSFTNASRIDNARVETVAAVIAEADSAADVACAMRAAVNCNATFAVLAGGHGAAGYGLSADGVVLSLRGAEMSSIGPLDAQSGALWVGAGARFSEIYAYAASSGTDWVPIGGGCPQVGAGGFLLGGGWSFLSRSYGLGSDNVRAWDVVLANGSAVHVERSSASEPSHPLHELWWALQGGGGGNFGVVTAFELQLQQPAPRMGLVGELCWAPLAPQVRAVFATWLAAWATMPSELDVDPVWLPLGEGGSRLFCITVVCNSASEAACASHVAPYRALGAVAHDTLRAAPFLEWQMANVNATEAQSGLLYLKSGVLAPGALTLAIVDDLMRALAAAPSNKSLVLFHVGGGAIAQIGASATAFPHRGAQLIVQVKSIWATPSEEAANVAWVRDVFRTVLAPALSGSYVNYIDKELDAWEAAYYGANYPRLQRVKQAVDPTNFFRFAQSIALPA